MHKTKLKGCSSSVLSFISTLQFTEEPINKMRTLHVLLVANELSTQGHGTQPVKGENITGENMTGVI